MSHRDQLAHFDAAAAQMRSRIQAGTHECKAERAGESLTLSVTPKAVPAPEPEPVDPFTDMAEPAPEPAPASEPEPSSDAPQE